MVALDIHTPTPITGNRANRHRTSGIPGGAGTLDMTLDLREDENESDEEYDWDESDWDTGQSEVPRAFALAARLTGVRFIPDLLDRVMLVGPVAYR